MVADRKNRRLSPSDKGDQASIKDDQNATQKPSLHGDGSRAERKICTKATTGSPTNQTGCVQTRKSMLSVPWNSSCHPDAEPFSRAVGLSPATTCALLLIRSALLSSPGFLERSMKPGAVSVLHLPDRDWSLNIVEAWSLIAREDLLPGSTTGGDIVAAAAARRLARARALRGELHNSEEEIKQVIALDGAPSIRRSAIDRADAANMHRITHAFSPAPDALLPPDLILAEDQRLAILLPDADILRLLACALCLERGWPSVQPLELPSGISTAAGTLTPSLVDLAQRPGQTPTSYLDRLAALMAKRDATAPRGKEQKGITLDDLPGLGEAGSWGRQMVADLQAYAAGTLPWSEIDRGVVLEGPPGTGKSTLARALSNSAGTAFISTSLAQWQGDRDGHLGTLCAAMRRTFEQARRQAPCIVLIDEVDAFPTRTAIRHAYRDYVVQVVNALLEQLDGAVDRIGVLVIATCNDASGLDPALVRSGRLEKIIRLERPDEKALEEIARVYLGDNLADADLQPLTMVAHRRNAVGADVEHWCRGARRRARTAGRPMLLEDLIEEIGEAPPMHGREAIWRMAVHEAGHVVACVVVAPLSLRVVVVDPQVGGKSATVFDTFDLYREVPNPTRAQTRKRLMATLAGRAAEEVVLGEPSSGSGGSAASDLATATRVAGLLVASSGLDEHPEALVFLGDADDQRRLDHLLLVPEVRQRVAAILRDAYADALDFVRRHRAGVERVAAALVERGSLSGKEARDLVGDLELGEDAR